MAAGAATKKGVIGYIVPFGNSGGRPSHQRIRSRRPGDAPGREGEARSGRTSGTRPPKETAAAQSLISSGVDVLGQNVDSPSAGVYAEKHGFPGWATTRTRRSSPRSQWLTAAVYNWGPYYLRRVKAAMNGTWKPGFYYGRSRTASRTLAPYGPKVSAKTRQLIARKKKAIRRASSTSSRAAVRPEGQARDPAGKRLNVVPDLYSMQWLVKGVIGRSPRSSLRASSWGSCPAQRRERERRRVTRRLSRSRRADGRITKRFPGVVANDGRRLRGAPSARCTPCSARTAPARRRSRTSSPGLYRPGRGRDRAVRRGPCTSTRRETRSTRASAWCTSTSASSSRSRSPRTSCSATTAGGSRASSSTRRRSSGASPSRRALRARRRSARAGLAAVRRGAAAGRDPQGALPRGAHPDPGRANSGPHPPGGGGSSSRRCAGWPPTAGRSSSSRTSSTR